MPFWQSKTLYLAIVNDFSENERSFAIAAYPVWDRGCVFAHKFRELFPESYQKHTKFSFNKDFAVITLNFKQIGPIAEKFKRHTVMILNFWTPENVAEIYLKFKKTGQSFGYFVQKDANGIANSEDPDQTAPLGAV